MTVRGLPSSPAEAGWVRTRRGAGASLWHGLPREGRPIDLQGGAGGPEHLPGDYQYGNHRLPHREAGQWGILRVFGAGSPQAATLPPSLTGQQLLWPAAAAVVLAVGAGLCVAV